MARTNTKTPIVSIGMPVWNAENYIKEALDSILKQTFKHFELIISDNGSTDTTQKICERYAKKDKRIKYIRHDTNKGAAWNYNYVVGLASGKYFKWQAHDDTLHAKFLEECVHVLDKNPDVVVSYTLIYIIDADGNKLKVYTDKAHFDAELPHQRYKQFFDIYKVSAWCNPIFGLFRTDELKKTVLIGSWLASDLTLLGEIVLYGKFHQVDKTLFFQRRHKDNSMLAYDEYERMWWFDPSKYGKFYATQWRWLVEYISAVRRARLGFKESFLCYIEILKWSYVVKKRLFKQALRFIVWPILKVTRYRNKPNKK